MREGNNTTNKKKAQDIVVCADWKLQKKKLNSMLTGGTPATGITADGWVRTDIERVKQS